jgi:hypothetical protein
MESTLAKEMNFDYSKPYKSPDKLSNRSTSRKNSEKFNPLKRNVKEFKIDVHSKRNNSHGIENQVISLSNSKHFDSKKNDSLLNKIKENQIDNIDLNNLDLGRKKHMMHSSKLKESFSKYNQPKNPLSNLL